MYKEKDSFITETVFFIWCKNLLKAVSFVLWVNLFCTKGMPRYFCILTIYQVYLVHVFYLLYFGVFLTFYPWWYKFFSLWQFDDFLFCMYKLYHIFLHSSTSFNRNQSKTFRQNPCFFDIRRGNWQINKDCLIAGIHFRWYNVKNV